MQHLKEYYKNYWEDGSEKWSPRDLRITDKERALILDEIKRNAKVLDVGCGDGRIGRFISRSVDSYTGIDLSESAISLCQKHGLNVKQQDLCERYSFEDGTFDVCVSFEVLEHLIRPDFCISEVARVLRFGGKLIGSVPNAVYFAARLMMLGGIFNPGGSPITSLAAPWKDPHIRFFNARSLRRMLEEEGRFSEVTIIGDDFSFSDFPVIYRLSNRTKRAVDVISTPLKFFGRLMPSIFSSRLFFVCRK